MGNRPRRPRSRTGSTDPGSGDAAATRVPGFYGSDSGILGVPKNNDMSQGGLNLEFDDSTNPAMATIGGGTGLSEQNPND